LSQTVIENTVDNLDTINQRMKGKRLSTASKAFASEEKVVVDGGKDLSNT
jgi:hypothetical protein